MRDSAKSTMTLVGVPRHVELAGANSVVEAEEEWAEDLVVLDAVVVDAFLRARMRLRVLPGKDEGGHDDAG